MPNPKMIEEGRGKGRTIVDADLNEFEPDAPVTATTIFRAIYYTRDRLAFLRRVAGYTEKKLVFDLNPRQYRLDDVLADLREAGSAERRTPPVLRPPDARATRPGRRRVRRAGAQRPARAARAPLPVHLPGGGFEVNE